MCLQQMAAKGETRGRPRRTGDLGEGETKGRPRGDPGEGETQGKGKPRETQGRPRGRGNPGRPRGGPGGTRAREGLHCPEQPSGAGKQQRDDQETKSRTTSQ